VGRRRRQDLSSLALRRGSTLFDSTFWRKVLRYEREGESGRSVVKKSRMRRRLLIIAGRN